MGMNVNFNKGTEKENLIAKGSKSHLMQYLEPFPLNPQGSPTSGMKGNAHVLFRFLLHLFLDGPQISHINL